MFGSWFKDKTIGDPVKQLPQIGELFDEVKKLRSMISSICPHKKGSLFDKGEQKYGFNSLTVSWQTYENKLRYGMRCDTCNHEKPMTKLEYLRAQKELIESSIKESE